MGGDGGEPSHGMAAGSHSGGSAGSTAQAGAGADAGGTGAGGENVDAVAGAGGDNGSATAGAGGASSNESGGAGGSGGAENGGAGSDPEVPPTVSALGCFATSGDSWDFLELGKPAYVMSQTVTCGGNEVSNDPNGFAPQATPTSFTVTRKFIIDDALLSASKLTLSFASDDAASFILNGHEIGACTPPQNNIGACSQTCQVLEFPAEYLLGGGQVNELYLEVINLLSVDAGNGNFGWTGITYSICATAQ